MKITEQSIHIESAKQINHIFKMRWPEYIVNGKAPLMHPASGEKRNIKTAVKLKAMNVIKGYPDYLLDLPSKEWNGLRIELKKPKTATQQKGYLSPEQKEWKAFFKVCNIRYEVCYSVQEVVDYVLEYMEGI